MNRYVINLVGLLFAVLLGCTFQVYAQKKKGTCEYAILVSKAVREDLAWKKLTETLKMNHGGVEFDYNQYPGEVFDKLKQAQPRYVTVVEKAEKVTPLFVRMMHAMSRNMSDTPYEDFVWGIITGEQAVDAMRMVTDAQTPKKVDMGGLEACELEKLSGYNGVNWSTGAWKDSWKERMKTPAKHTVAEAVFLQQQCILERLAAWDPKSLGLVLPENEEGCVVDDEAIRILVKKELGKECTGEQIELLKNRDVLVYYGDPKWNIRLKEVLSPFKMTCKKQRLLCTVTFESNGKACDIDEYIFFFPKRLEEPSLLAELREGEELLFDDTFMIIRNVHLEAGEKYSIKFSVEGADSMGIKVMKILQSKSVEF